MRIDVSPTLRRLLIELALGRDVLAADADRRRDLWPPPPDTTADRASDLLAATSAPGLSPRGPGAEAPEAARLADRIRGLVAELVTAQNDDGGWPWVAAPRGAEAAGQRPAGLGARGLRPGEAEPLGLLPEPAVARQGGRLPGPRSSPGRRQRPRDPGRGPARPGRAGQGDLRAGQQPEPGPPEPARRRAGVPRPDPGQARPRRPWPARSSTSSPRGPGPSRPAPGQKPRKYWEGRDQGP